MSSFMTPARSMLFFDLLATHLEGGMTPAEALACIAEDSPERAHRRLAKRLSGQLGQASLREALTRQGTLLPPVVVRYLGTCADADLAAGLRELAAYCATRRTLDERYVHLNGIQRATVWLCAAMFFGIMILVVPVFKDVFSGFGSDLPAFTRGIIAVSDFVLDGGWLLLVLFALRRPISRRFPTVAQVVDRALMVWPGVRRKQSLVATSMVLDGALFLEKHGVARGDAVATAAAGLDNAWLRLTWEKLARALAGGASWPDSLRGADAVPRSVRGHAAGDIAGVAEKTRELATTSVAIYAERSSLLVYVVVGIVIAIMVVGMYLPIFKLGSAVG